MKKKVPESKSKVGKTKSVKTIVDYLEAGLEEFHSKEFISERLSKEKEARIFTGSSPIKQIGGRDLLAQNFNRFKYFVRMQSFKSND